MEKIYNIIILLAAAVILTSCSSDLPRSGGSPYDVCIISENEHEGNIVLRELAKCEEVFTTSEKMFRLNKSIGFDGENVMRLSRCIIIPEIKDVDYTTCIREKNLWAAPQLVIYIQAPSAERLYYDIRELRDMIADEINKFEREQTIYDIERHRNITLSDSVKKNTGCSIYVPAGMKIAKSEKNFIWLSDNMSDSRNDICIYRLPNNSLTTDNAETITALRDSVMHRHIYGADTTMHYRIVPQSERTYIKGDTVIIHNRWEITGYAMGGSSVCRVINTEDGLVIADAFIYTPSTDKRNKIRRAEACLFTIKTDK